MTMTILTRQSQWQYWERQSLRDVFQAHLDAIDSMELDDEYIPPTDIHSQHDSFPVPEKLNLDPSHFPIENIVNGTFKPSVVFDNCDGYLDMERSLDGEL